MSGAPRRRNRTRAPDPRYALRAPTMRSSIQDPIDLVIMAKGVYPDRFADLAVHDWVLEFYRRTYRVDEGQARLLRRSQWLEWTAESAF